MKPLKTILTLLMLAAPVYGTTTMPRALRSDEFTHEPTLRQTFTRASAPRSLSTANRLFTKDRALLVPPFALTPTVNSVATKKRTRAHHRLLTTALRMFPAVARAAIGYRIAGGPVGLAPLGVALVLQHLQGHQEPDTTMTYTPQTTVPANEIARLEKRNESLRREIETLSTTGADHEVNQPSAAEPNLAENSPPPSLMPIMRAPTQKRHRSILKTIKRAFPLVAEAATGFAVAGPIGLTTTVVPMALSSLRARNQRGFLRDMQKLESSRTAIWVNQLKIENLELRRQLDMVKFTILLQDQ